MTKHNTSQSITDDQLAETLATLGSMRRDERRDLWRQAEALGEPCDMEGCANRPTRSIRFVETHNGKTHSHGGFVRCDEHIAEVNTRPVNEAVSEAQRKRFRGRGHHVDVRIRNS